MLDVETADGTDLGPACTAAAVSAEADFVLTFALRPPEGNK